MAINPDLVVVTSDVDTFFVNKDTAQPLANGTLSFFEDMDRNVQKAVYEISGSAGSYTYTTMGAIVTLSGSGTVQDSTGANEVIYYYPYDDDLGTNVQKYYVVGADQNGIVQFTRENWPPIGAASVTPPPSSSSTNAENQISNPNFTNVFLNNNVATTFNFTGATNVSTLIGPDWNLIVSGTGSVIIQQTAISGSNNLPSSPPYVINISVASGITKCLMQQNFNNNSGLWAGTASDNIYLNGSFVARNALAGTVTLPMFYTASNLSADIQIASGSLDASYIRVTGSSAAPIPSSSDVFKGVNGFVAIYLSFPPASNILFSAVQVVPSQTAAIQKLGDDFNSSNRDEAYQGDYYIPALNARQMCSYLIGWDFPINPNQFVLPPSVTLTPAYIVDQTIAACSGANVAFTINSATEGLQFNSTDANNSFYILQYLNSDTVKDMITNNLSANVFAYQNGVTGGPVSMQIFLFTAPASASIPLLSTGTIGTIATDGTFSLSPSSITANWKAIARGGLNTPLATLSVVQTNDQINNGNNDYGFTGWQITDSTLLTNTDKFCIVVSFAYKAACSVVVNSVSLIPSKIPSRPLVLSDDETLRQCQYYYEKSYNPGSYAGTSDQNASLVVEQLGTSTGTLPNAVYRLFPKIAQIFCKETKRSSNPLITIYSVTGAAGNVTSIVADGGGIQLNLNTPLAPNGWTVSLIGTKSFALLPLQRSSPASQLVVPTAAPQGQNEGYIQFHYIMDARLGIV